MLYNDRCVPSGPFINFFTEAPTLFIFQKSKYLHGKLGAGEILKKGIYGEILSSNIIMFRNIVRLYVKKINTVKWFGR